MANTENNSEEQNNQKQQTDEISQSETSQISETSQKNKKRTVSIINGPNLNLLGKREPEIYGKLTLKALEESCGKMCKALNLNCSCFQSNSESKIVDHIQQQSETSGCIIINAAAYSHTSIAILDALKNFQGIIIEVHLSNIYKREDFRHHSYISQVADGVICGLGISGYHYAILHYQERIN